MVLHPKHKISTSGIYPDPRKKPINLPKESCLIFFSLLTIYSSSLRKCQYAPSLTSLQRSKPADGFRPLMWNCFVKEKYLAAAMCCININYISKTKWQNTPSLTPQGRVSTNKWTVRIPALSIYQPEKKDSGSTTTVETRSEGLNISSLRSGVSGSV